jgi:NhaP-type Na+/H+ or K+/H+ antiporter
MNKKFSLQEFIFHTIGGLLIGALVGYAIYCWIGNKYSAQDAKDYLIAGAIVGGLYMGFTKVTLRHW